MDLKALGLAGRRVNGGANYIGLFTILLGVMVGVSTPVVLTSAGVSIFWVLIGVTVAIIAKVLYRDYFNPLTIWGIFWVTVVGISSLLSNTIPWLEPWLPKTWLSVTYSTISFILGYILVAMSPRRRVRQRNWIYEIYDWKKLQRCAFVLLLISVTTYLILAVRHGIPLFSENPDLMRIKFQERYYWSIVNFGKVACVIWALAPTRYKAVGFMVGIYLFLLTLTGWRGTVLDGFLFVLVGWNLRHRIRLKAILLLILLALGCFYGVGFLRSSSITNKPLEIVYYMAPNFVNFQHLITNQSGYTWGIYSLRGIYQFVLPSLGAKVKYVKPSFEIMGYNVSTYMLLPYLDGGMAGIIAISFLIGVIAGYSYYRCRTSISLPWVVLFASNIIGIIHMHNSFFWESSSWIYWLILAYAGHIMSKRRWRRWAK